MEAVAFEETLQKLYIHLLAFALAIARITPIVVIVPAFTRLGIAGIVQGGVAMALAIPLVPIIVGVLGPDLPTLGKMAPLMLKEPLIGVIIGLVLGVPFWAAEAAGEVVDYQRATAFAALADPASSTQQSVTGAFLSVAIVGLFYVSGGLDILIGVIYDSYAIWPPANLGPVLGADAGIIVIGLMDSIFRLGVMLLVPLILALLLTDVLLALLARAAPNLHVFDISMGLKSLVLTALLVLYLGFLARYMADTLRQVPQAPALLQRIMGGAANR